MGWSYEETLHYAPWIADQHPDAPGQRKPLDRRLSSPVALTASLNPIESGRQSLFCVPDWHPSRINELSALPLGGYKRKKRDRIIIAWRASMCGVPRASGKRLLRLILLFPKGKRMGDPDSYWKSLCDALVQCGALVNDSKDWVELAPVEYFRGATMMSIVILEDLV